MNESTPENLHLFAAGIDLDAAHKAHMRWLTSGGKQGKRLHLRNTDLEGLNMAGFTLAEASLRGIVIRDVDLSAVDLRGSDLAETVFENVNLKGAMLNSALFMGAQFINVNLEGADLTGADLQGIMARDISFTGARMNKCTMRDATLQHADFSHAQLRDTILRAVSCMGAKFDNADLANSECREGVFDYASFSHANVDNVIFKDASLRGVDIHNVNFTKAHDVVFDEQTQAFIKERARLDDLNQQLTLQVTRQENRTKILEGENTTLRARERTNRLREAKLEGLIYKLSRVAMAYGLISIVWLSISAFLVAFTYSRLSQLDLNRIIGILAGVGLVIILSFLSFYFAIKTRKILFSMAEKAEPDTNNNMSTTTTKQESQ